MKLGTKENVLLAIYIEYQKDLPDMGSVNNMALNMDIDVFNVALEKLQNEEYINGVSMLCADNNRFYSVDTSHMKLTKQGIDFVEHNFGIAKELTAEDKLKYIVKKCGVFGYKVLKDIAIEAIKNMV